MDAVVEREEMLLATVEQVRQMLDSGWTVYPGRGNALCPVCGKDSLTPADLNWEAVMKATKAELLEGERVERCSANHFFLIRSLEFVRAVTVKTQVTV